MCVPKTHVPAGAGLRASGRAYRSRRSKPRGGGGPPVGRRAVTPPSRNGRRFAGAAVGLPLLGIVAGNLLLEPTASFRWSYQALFLCLLVAAGARRALVGGPPRAEGRAPRLPDVWLGCAVALAAALPYLHGLRIGFLSDDYGIAAAIRGAASPFALLRLRPYVLFFRPLSELVWWAGGRLWGAAPLGYHILNVALHALNSVLVFALGIRLMGDRTAAWLSGMLFAVHPIHVEPVVWAACQPDLLAAAFSLLALLLLEVHISASTRAAGRSSLLGSLAAFGLAVMSKESSLAVPGVVALRLRLSSPPASARRLVGLTGCYCLVLLGLLGWRLAAVGRLGGYDVTLSFWNTAFPSALLTQVNAFLLPLNRAFLFKEGGYGLLAVALLPIALGAFWFVFSLNRIPAKRLWFHLGYLAIMSVPVWHLGNLLGNLADSRLAYLPTVSLAWIFGEIARPRGASLRRHAAAAAALLAVGAGLTAAFVVPWRNAAKLAGRVVAATERVVAELPARPRRPALFVRGLPDNLQGAQVFRNCFKEALTQRLGRPLQITCVASGPGSSGVPSEVMAVSALLPGEYELAWEEEKAEMQVMRACPPSPEEEATAR